MPSARRVVAAVAACLALAVASGACSSEDPGGVTPSGSGGSVPAGPVSAEAFCARAVALDAEFGRLQSSLAAELDAARSGDGPDLGTLPGSIHDSVPAGTVDPGQLESAEQELIDFLGRSWTELAAVAPEEVRADAEVIRDRYLAADTIEDVEAVTAIDVPEAASLQAWSEENCPTDEP